MKMSDANSFSINGNVEIINMKSIKITSDDILNVD